MRVGIYGGTFNPPHIGHLRSAKAAVRQLGLDLLIVVPAGIPPHKPLPSASPSADLRFQMTSIAFRGVENAVVSDIEVKKGQDVNYAIDTVATIKEEYPQAQLFLLVGTDMFLTLQLWRDFEPLLKAVTPAVFSRGSDDLKKVVAHSVSIQKRYDVSIETVINNVIEISSSQLREMLPIRDGVEYVTGDTYSFIIKNRLYSAKPDWAWLRSRAFSMLKTERIPHVAGCEEEAVRLAKHWGANTDDAREAAILHDITKKLDLSENMAILEKYGITIGELKKGEEKLLHSKTAAAVARAEFGASDPVAEAIMWHTTGRAKMTKLDKIIYLADYIEPVRDFDGVDILRALSYESLDEAYRMGLEISIADLKARGIMPNQTTIDALNDL